MRCNSDDGDDGGELRLDGLLVYNALDGSSWIRPLLYSPTHSFQNILQLLSYTFISRGTVSETRVMYMRIVLFQLTTMLQLCSLFVSILYYYTTRTLELCSVSVLQTSIYT
ncbi:hypothetical protein J3459_010331 [Metarhizium acridum]|nr:hypothetical protein J3459_010331 [Metarhizium acridum]